MSASLTESSLIILDPLIQNEFKANKHRQGRKSFFGDRQIQAMGQVATICAIMKPLISEHKKLLPRLLQDELSRKSTTTLKSLSSSIITKANVQDGAAALHVTPIDPNDLNKVKWHEEAQRPTYNNTVAYSKREYVVAVVQLLVHTSKGGPMLQISNEINRKSPVEIQGRKVQIPGLVWDAVQVVIEAIETHSNPAIKELLRIMERKGEQLAKVQQLRIEDVKELTEKQITHMEQAKDKHTTDIKEVSREAKDDIKEVSREAKDDILKAYERGFDKGVETSQGRVNQLERENHTLKTRLEASRRDPMVAQASVNQLEGEESSSSTTEILESPAAKKRKATEQPTSSAHSSPTHASTVDMDLVASLQKQLKAATSDSQGQTALVASLQEKLETAKSDAQSKGASLQKQLETATSDAQSKEASLESFREQLKASKSDAQSKEASLESFQEQLRAAKSDCENQKALVASLKGVLEGAKSEEFGVVASIVQESFERASTLAEYEKPLIVLVWVARVMAIVGLDVHSLNVGARLSAFTKLQSFQEFVEGTSVDDSFVQRFAPVLLVIDKLNSCKGALETEEATQETGDSLAALFNKLIIHAHENLVAEEKEQVRDLFDILCPDGYALVSSDHFWEFPDGDQGALQALIYNTVKTLVTEENVDEEVVSILTPGQADDLNGDESESGGTGESSPSDDMYVL